MPAALCLHHQASPTLAHTRDPRAPLALVEVEGHEAGVAHMRAEHAEFLLAVDDAGRRAEIEHELAQCEAVVQAAHGWLARQRGISGAGSGLADEHLQDRIMTQMVAVVAIGVAADHLHDTLGEQRLSAVLWRTRLARAGCGSFELGNQPGVESHEGLVKTKTQRVPEGSFVSIHSVINSSAGWFGMVESPALIPQCAPNSALFLSL